MILTFFCYKEVENKYVIKFTLSVICLTSKAKQYFGGYNWDSVSLKVKFHFERYNWDYVSSKARPYFGGYNWEHISSK